MPQQPRHMKWWGWGDEDVEFDCSDKPALWPYIARQIHVTGELDRTPPVPLDSIQLPIGRLSGQQLAGLSHLLPPDRIANSQHERLLHSYGKSFRDLWRVRSGQIQASPDCIVYPESEAEVVAIVRWAGEQNVVLIPFGGGSNIAGCLEARSAGNRPVVSLDLTRMNRVLSVDHQSQTATIEAGVFGPHLEQQLAAEGMTLGHFPDSFLHSTLGGWIATRSAGMQSDKYGKIEDMVLALRMVTPSGNIVTRTVPRASNGIDINRLCIGSEGILGVITQATMQVHPIPDETLWLGYLFPDFSAGLAAISEGVRADCSPVVTRLNDPQKTALSFAFKSRQPWLAQQVSRGMKWWLGNVKRFDFDACCLMIVKFEGSPRDVRRQRRKIEAIYRRQGGVCLGTGPGKSFERGKFDFPYLRDWLMDRRVYADVSETATVWSNLRPLYESCRTSIDRAIQNTGCLGWLGCHISHTYHTGASLYFTFAWYDLGADVLAHYDSIKGAAEDAFLAGGATLSHHHAVGTEHLPWIEQDVSPTGVLAIRGLKEALDPLGIMNPGKVIPEI